MKRQTLAIAMLFLTLVKYAPQPILAQAMPTTGVFTRISMIESRKDRGTIFSIDVDGREYWVTAKHILTGDAHLPVGILHESSVDVKVLNPSGAGETWLPVHFSILDPGDGIDLVVLVPNKLLLEKPLPNVALGGDGVMFGGTAHSWDIPMVEAGRQHSRIPNSCGFRLRSVAQYLEVSQKVRTYGYWMVSTTLDSLAVPCCGPPAIRKKYLP